MDDEKSGILQWPLAHKKMLLTILFVCFVVYFFSLARVNSQLHIPNSALFSGISYSALLSIWTLSVKKRIIERDMRYYCLAMALLMVFFVVVRTVKWVLCRFPTVAQLSWYMYYIPHILLPFFLFLIALSFDKKLALRCRHITKWLSFLAVCLIALILTNYFHQRVFKIIEWTPNYDVIKYQPLAVLIALWLCAFISLTIALLITKSKLPHTNRRIVMPLFVVLAYALYLALYSIDPSTEGVGFVEFMVMECLFYISLIESLIYVGLIPSNSNYRTLFENSPIPIAIVDRDNRLLCKSNAEPSIDAQLSWQLVKGEQRDIGDWRLCSKKIDGGRVLWLDDISDTNAKISKIDALNRALSQETNLLRDELLLAKKEISLRQKDRIYHSIERAICEKRDRISNMIETLPNEPSAARATLMHICLVGAFIKRMSNIILLEELYGDINAIELQNAIAESLMSYRLKNAATHSQQFVDFAMSGKRLKLIYAYFESELEYYFEHDADLAVSWHKKNNCFELTWCFSAANLSVRPEDGDLRAQLSAVAICPTRHVTVDQVEVSISVDEAAKHD